MAKITLEVTDSIIRVSGPSSFLPLNKTVGSSTSQFKIVLDTKTATADLSKIGTAADNTTLVFFGNSTDYQVNYNAKTGIANVVNSAMKIVASLPIPKLAADNVRLHFADYADATNVTLGKPAAGYSSLVLSSKPDLAPTVTLSSSAAAVNEGSAVTYTATLNKVSATDLNIPYTLGGNATLTADYTGSVATTGNIKIVAGALTGTLVLTAVPDAKTEGAETVSVALGAAAAVTTTINDTSLTPIVPTVAVARAIAVKATDANTVATAVDANGAVANLNDNVAFNISAGTFGYAIKNFAAGDKLNFFANAVVNVLPDTNNTDGIQVLTAQDAATGTTTTVTLTGLTADQDLGVFNFPSFATIFGAGSMTVDGLFTAATTPGVAPVKATPVTVSATTATAPFVATANSDTFTIASGTYAATIDKFAATDVLKFFTGAIINVLPDIDNADGKQVLTAQDSTTGTTATITLTGLTAAQDAGLFNQPSFATVFGAGTIA